VATKKRRKKTSAAGVVTAEFGHQDAKGGGGKNPRLPEGDYVAKIIDAKQKESKEGNQMIVWIFQIIEGKYKGKKLTGRTVLVPKALFMLRDLLEALGKEVPEKTVKVKYGECVGEKIGISLEDGEYENKATTEVNGFLDADMVGAEEDDDDEDDDDLDDEDDEDDDESDLDDMDRDELKAYIKENDLDVKVKKSWDEDDIREAIGEAEDDDDLDDEDDMEEVDLDEL